MKISSAVRTTLIALVALVGLSSASFADSGTVRLTIYKAVWIIGGSGGSGTLYFRGRTYVDGEPFCMLCNRDPRQSPRRAVQRSITH